MEFKEYKLGEVVEAVIDYRGKTPKKLGGDWSETGYRAFSAKNIKTGKIVQPDTIRFVSRDIYKKWMREEVEKGTILITSEAPFGECYYWDSEEKIVLSQRLFGLKIKKEFHSKYIFYFLTGSKFQSELKNRSTGSTVTGLRQPELLKCKLLCPSLDNQKKIAKILSSLDAKIELNNRLNVNLQEISNRLYKRWFIDFEFPNDEGDSYKKSGGIMVNSEFGDIPLGWQIGFFDDNELTRIIKSGVLKYKGVKKYIATADVEGTVIKCSNLVDFEGRPSRANMTPIANSIWFAKMQDSTKNIDNKSLAPPGALLLLRAISLANVLERNIFLDF